VIDDHAQYSNSSFWPDRFWASRRAHPTTT
jgi:hypothetical protein